MRLPKPPLPPFSEAHALADLGHVGEKRLAVLGEDLGAGRHLQHDVVALAPGAVLAHAVLAAAGP